tara:strand:+ start:706 stop:1071 length:366 start_codon:yes stop_codon:yes gene_type:complete
MFLIDTYLDRSEIHGVGVFSKENINKGRKIKEERPEFEMEFNKNKLPSIPLALAKLIDTHAHERKLGSGILVLGLDNEKYLNHSNNPSVNDDGIALKDIKIGDEITIDYRDFDDNIKTWLT